MRRGPTRAVATLPILLLLAAAGCTKRSEEGAGGEAGGEPVVQVRTAAVELREFARAITAPGQWRSGGELVLSAPFAGVVESLGVRAGDPVAAGRHVGWIVTRDSWAALEGAERMARENGDAAARAEGERALRLARREVVRVPLVAREAGVVVRRSVEPGAQVAEGGEILAIAPARTVVFEARVPAAEAGAVRPGQVASVRSAGAPERAATVQRVLPVASGADQAVPVWLVPGGTGGFPELDRYGTAAIVVGASHRAPAVPDSALVEDDLTGERRVALVDRESRLRWTAVALGQAAGGWHEVLHPTLVPGTRVAIEGQTGLPAGTRVRPQP